MDLFVPKDVCVQHGLLIYCGVHIGIFVYIYHLEDNYSTDILVTKSFELDLHLVKCCVAYHFINSFYGKADNISMVYMYVV